jgi:hypothetical protein
MDQTGGQVKNGSDSHNDWTKQRGQVIPVIGSDWQRLDGYYNYNLGYWESYPDCLGCEWYGE